MVEYCDRCGTTLVDDKERHRTYRIETPDEEPRVREGRLCSVCVVDLQEWLEETEFENEDEAEAGGSGG